MTVRKIMDAAAARLHELKDELQMIELHEYHYIDGAMIELKLIPYEVEILYPAMFIHRPIEIQDMWEKIQVCVSQELSAEFLHTASNFRKVKKFIYHLHHLQKFYLKIQN